MSSALDTASGTEDSHAPCPKWQVQRVKSAWLNVSRFALSHVRRAARQRGRARLAGVLALAGLGTATYFLPLVSSAASDSRALLANLITSKLLANLSAADLNVSKGNSGNVSAANPSGPLPAASTFTQVVSSANPGGTASQISFTVNVVNSQGNPVSDGTVNLQIPSIGLNQTFAPNSSYSVFMPQGTHTVNASFTPYTYYRTECCSDYCCGAFGSCSQICCRHYCSVPYWNYNSSTAPTIFQTIYPDVTYNNSSALPPGTYNRVTINPPAVALLTGNVTVVNSFTVNSGATLDTRAFNVSGGGSFTLGAGATLEIGDPNGIAASPTAAGSIRNTGGRTLSSLATYIYDGSESQIVGNGLPGTVLHLRTNNSGGNGNNIVTGNSGQIVTGTLQVQTGVYSSASDYHDVVINSGAEFSLTGDITVSGNWTNNGTFTHNNHKVTFDGSNNTQIINGSTSFYDLAINHSGAGSVIAAGSTLAVTHLAQIQSGTFTSATQYHDIQIDNGGTFALSGPILVDGNWNLNPGGTFTHNNFGVTFNGTGAQTITAGGAGAGKTFAGVAINKGNGTVTLSGHMEVAGVLTLTSGKVTTSSSNLLTVTNTATGAVSGGSATSYINGPLARVLPASLAAGSTYTFPVGKAGFSPFDLNDATTTSGGAVTLMAEEFDGATGGTAGTGLSSINADRYWSASITSGGGNFTNTRIKLTNSSALLSSNRVGKSATQAGGYDATGGSVSGSTITSDAFSGFSFFVIGAAGVGDVAVAINGAAIKKLNGADGTVAWTASVSNDSVLAVDQSDFGVYTGKGGFGSGSGTTYKYNASGGLVWTGSVTAGTGFGSFYYVNGAAVDTTSGTPGVVFTQGNFGGAGAMAKSNRLTGAQLWGLGTNAIGRPTIDPADGQIFDITSGGYGRIYNFAAGGGAGVTPSCEGTTDLNPADGMLYRGGGGCGLQLSRMDKNNLLIPNWTMTVPGIASFDTLGVQPWSGGYIYVGSNSSSKIVVINPATQTVVNTFTTAVPPHVMAVNPNSGTLYVASTTGNFVYAYSPNGGLLWTSPDLGAAVYNLASPRNLVGTAPAVLKYRSLQSGNWHDFNTWEVDAGSGFVNAVVGQIPYAGEDTIQIQNGHTVTVASDVTADQLTVDAGGILTVNSGVTFTVANGTGTDLSNSGTVNINGTVATDGSVANLGTTNVNGTFQLNEGGSAFFNSFVYGSSSTLSYSGTTAQNTTNNEFPSTNGPTNLIISNAAGVMLNGPRTISGTLNLISGQLTTTTTNLVTVSNTATNAISGGSASAYINGPLARVLPASLSGSNTYAFPVGKGGFNPFDLIDASINSGGSVTVLAEEFDGNSAGTPGTGLTSLNTDRYWSASITSESGNFTSTRMRLTNSSALSATNRIGKSSSANGAYNSIGGTVSGTQITSDAITSFSFFAIGTLSCPSSLTVNSNGDASDASAGDGVCETASGNGVCTLRAAIQELNALVACGPINIDFSITTPNTINLGSPLPTVAHQVNISGPGANLLTVQRASGSFRIFNITAGATAVTISGLTISQGSTTSEGGGVRNEAATLNLNDCVISNNSVLTFGGGIYNQSGTLNITGCTISGNSLSGFSNGGGLFVNGGTVNITNSTFTGNSASNVGGGLFVQTTGTANITNSTIGTGNTAARGAGIFNNGTLAITNSTISGNTAGNRGGGLNNEGGNITLTHCTISGNSAGEGGGLFKHQFSNPVSIKSTIIAGNSAPTAPDVANNPTSLGHNLIGNGDGSTGFGTTGDQAGTTSAPIDPRLGALTNNGGPTMSHALLAHSPAHDAADNAAVTIPPFLNTSPINDQRGPGFPRILDAADANTTQTVDIGAFEARASVEDISNKVTSEGTLLSFNFHVGDASTITSVTASSGNPTLVPNQPANINVTGSGSTRTLNITPAAGQIGAAVITVTVSAGTESVSDTFVLTVCFASVVVTSNADSGPGSLRQAIIDACPGATITFSGVVSPISLTSGQLTINKDLTIQGPGANLLTVQRSSGSFRIFNVTSGAATASISGLTVSNGSTFSEGAGIRNAAGTLTLTDCVLSGNVASTFGGGLYHQTGTLNVTGCTFLNNSLDNFHNGGAMHLNSGTVNITNSTFTGNSAVNIGGAIFAQNSSTVNVNGSTFVGNSAARGAGIFNNGALRIVNSTFDGNTASGNGGGLNDEGGSATIVNCTFAGNSSQGQGGGIYKHPFSGPVSLKNTIVALNSAPTGPDVAATNFTSQGYNLIGNGDSSSGFTHGSNGDQVGTTASPINPRLGLLASNGGPTQTRALTLGSPAIDAGAAANDPATGLPVTTDQRGSARPVDLDDATYPDTSNATDIGAYEAQTAPAPSGQIKFAQANTNGTETNADHTVNIAVQRTGGSNGIVTVNYATSDGMATVGSDYTAASGTLTWADGDTADKTITVTVKGDTTVEPNETVNLTLSNPQGGAVLGAQSTATLTILTDDVGTFGGKIVFTSERDGNREIYVMNADGSAQTRLTNNPAADEQASFSADGSRIAFRSTRDGNAEIYVMNSDGSGQTRLTNDPGLDVVPSFSADGSRIAFVSTRDNNLEIYVMNADGSGQTRLTNNFPLIDSNPAFSLDGSRIVFDSRRDGNQEIYVMNADGSGQINLSNHPNDDGSPGFSPDGSRITFGSARSAPEIYVMNADGSGQTQLTSNTSVEFGPEFGPDGIRIAFTSDRDGNAEIYSMNADGSDQTRLTNNPATDRDPSWAVGDVVSLSVGDASVSEGHSGTTKLTFTVTLSSAQSQNVTFNFSTADGTATDADNDYESVTNGSGTILATETTTTITIQVNGDTTFEPDETFTVTLSNPSGGVLVSAGTITGTITNDDPANVAPVWITSSITVTEPSGTQTNPIQRTATLEVNDGNDGQSLTFSLTGGTGQCGATPVAPFTGIIFDPNPVTSGGGNESTALKLNVGANDAAGSPYCVRVTVSDGAASATQDIEVSVTAANSSPVANNDNYATDENTPLNVSAPGVLTNDTEADNGQTRTAILVGGNPAHASSFTLNANGSFSYTPMTGFAGTDTFTYKAQDNSGDAATEDSNIATVTMTVNPTACTPAPSPMAAWYPGDGNADDIAGGHHGTLQNGATFGTGKVNQGFSLNGTNQYVSIMTAAPLPATFTLDTWVNATTLTNNPMVFSKDDGMAGGHFVQIEADGKLVASVRNTLGFFTQYRTNNPAVTAGSFHHIAVSYDGSAGPDEKMKFYVDSVNYPAAHISTYDQGGTPLTGSGNARIGTFVNGTLPFGGVIDEFEQFDRVLSAAEIQAIAAHGSFGKCRTCTPPPVNMIGWWPAEGTADDIAGSYDGTLEGGAGFGAGKVGQSFSLDGIDDRVNLGDLALPITFTIDAWIKPNSLPAGGAFILAKDDGVADDSYSLSSLSTGRLQMQVRNASNQLTRYITTDPAIAVGVWHHVAITYDGNAAAGQRIKFFIDGVNVAAVHGTFDFGDAPRVSAAPARIGIHGTSSLPFNGFVDELEVFTRVLSDLEIAAIANAGHAGKCHTSTSQFSSATYGVAENVSGGNATITVTRAGALNTAAGVSFETTTGGTATAGAGPDCATGDDYITKSGTLNFAANEASKTFTVKVCNDGWFDDGETVNLNLSSPTGNASLGTPNTATLTINDDEGPPNITINDVSMAEGSPSGTTNFIFTVTLSNPTQSGVTIGYSTANGSASAGSDYTAIANGSLAIPGNSSSGQITVQVSKDTTVETDETFLVNLNSTSVGTITDSQGVGTIQNDDANVSVTVFSPVSASVAEDGATNLVYRFTRAGATSGSLTVNFSVGGTATFNTDYTHLSGAATLGASSGTVTFGAGNSTADVTIDPTSDTNPEVDETVILTVNSGTGYNVISPSSASGTITNDDACPTTFTVNSNGDAADASPGDGSCATAGAVCTLRAAIEEANALTSCGTLAVDLSGLTGTIDLGSELPAINHNVNLTGPGANVLTVQRNSASNFRIFNIQPGTVVTIVGLTITNGNSGPGGSGGGILSRGTLTVRSCTISGNSAAVGGGGISNNGSNGSASLTIINSTISNNTSQSFGGGIFSTGFQGTATVNVVNSTIARNGGPSFGGGIYNGDSTGSATLNIQDSTISGNTAGSTAGGIYNFGNGSTAVLNLNNTIVAYNGGVQPSEGPDIFNFNGTVSGSNNIIQTTGGYTISGSSNQNVDPLLEKDGGGNPLLANNGGPTLTVRPLLGSPAINAGSNANLPADTFDLNSNSNTAEQLPVDQRGVGFARIVNTTVDIGAVEVNYAISATAGSGQSAQINTAFPTQLKATVTESGNTVSGIPVTFIAPASGASGSFASSATVNTDANGVATAPVFTANGTAGGSYNVTASLSGGSPSVTFSLTNLKGDQTIAINTHAPATAIYNTSFTVAATASSGLAVTYSSSGVCTNSGAMFTMTSGTGTCTVKYDQAENSNYNAAPQITETVNAQKANQTINFGALVDKTFGDADFNVSATGGASGNPVTFNPSGNCTSSGTNGSTIHLTGAGSCTITASQAGDSNYNAAPNVQQSFNIAKASTSTTVSSSINPSDFGQNVTFTATVTSGAGTPTGTVQFKDGNSNLGAPQPLNGSGVAQITTSTLTAGTHTITAEYSGDATFLASSGTLPPGQLVKPQPTLTINDVTVTEGNSGTADLTFTVTLSAASNLTVNVDYTTANGSATDADNDYQSTSGLLTFNPGDLTEQITVKVNGDLKTEPDETVFVVLSNPANAAFSDSQGMGTILNDDTLQLLLDTSGPDANQLAALDSLLLIRDPFRVRNTAAWFTSEQNTRVILFAENLQLNSGDSPSDVKINLIDGNGQPHEVPADDVRSIANTTFTQVTFRLPDLAEGTCLVTIKAHERISNTGTFRIVP